MNPAILFASLAGLLALFFSRTARASLSDRTMNLLPPAPDLDKNPGYARWKGAIALAEAREGLPAGLLARLIKQESNFNASAVSRTGVRGLAQVTAATARDPGYGVAPLADRTDGTESIRFAAQYLAAMHHEFGSWKAALAAYNVGPGQFAKTGYAKDQYGNDPVAYVASITRGTALA